MPDRTLTVSLRQADPIPLEVELTCEPGTVFAIFGPSGAGKTTILRSIAGLYRPANARIVSGAEVWTDTTAGAFVPPHERRVGFVFQEYALFPHMTAKGNVAAALGHRARAERRARAESLLARVHLGHHLKKRPHEMSGGERQRLALARALARDPVVLLLDEPFAAIDRKIRRELQDTLDQIRRSLEIPVVLVTHDFDDVVRLATNVLLIDHGRTVASGPIDTVLTRPDLAWLGQAVGLGSVFDATVAKTSADRGLAELTFDGGTLLTSSVGAPAGATLRVRIPAREIILATRAPEGLSLHNVLAGRVSAVHRDASTNHAIVQILIGKTRLLAEVTPDAVMKLGLAPGVAVFALIKSVAIDVVR